MPVNMLKKTDVRTDVYRTKIEKKFSPGLIIPKFENNIKLAIKDGNVAPAESAMSL
jgi:hypothetical protein